MPYTKMERSAPKDVWNWDKMGDTLEGYYIAKDENQGSRKNSTLYHIKALDGTMWKLWGSVILDDYFSQIPFKSRVKIVLTGTGTSINGKYRKFDVYSDTDDIMSNTPEKTIDIEKEDIDSMPPFDEDVPPDV